jgi:uncharacterized protein
MVATTGATPVVAATSDPDARWPAAVAAFDAGEYYEAHELWESLWNDAEGGERLFYQALVQIAAGYVKLEVGEVNGARKLFERGLARLAQSGMPRGVGESLLPAVEEALRRLRALPWGAAASLEIVPRPRIGLGPT